MNVKARLLGLWNTRFHDSTGLNPANLSSPRDLAKMRCRPRRPIR